MRQRIQFAVAFFAFLLLALALTMVSAHAMWPVDDPVAVPSDSMAETKKAMADFVGHETFVCMANVCLDQISFFNYDVTINPYGEIIVFRLDPE